MKTEEAAFELDKLLKSKAIPRRTSQKEKACLVFKEQPRQEITIRLICKFLGVTRNSFDRLFWRYLNGYSLDEQTKLDYLNDSEERNLREMVINATNDNKFMSKDEVREEAYKIKILREKESFIIYKKYFPDEKEVEIEHLSDSWLENFTKRNDLSTKRKRY